MLGEKPIGCDADIFDPLSSAQLVRSPALYREGLMRAYFHVQDPLRPMRASRVPPGSAEASPGTGQGTGLFLGQDAAEDHKHFIFRNRRPPTTGTTGSSHLPVAHSRR